MIKRTLFFVVGIFIMQSIFAEIPETYYDDATGTGYTLKTQLYNIIETNHLTLDYGDLYGYYETTDNINISGTDYVYDMYSIQSDGTADYYFEHVSADQCGTYSGESDCYNREHSMPQSWFNESSPMKADLFHVYPTDGYVNNRRSNYPFGEVGSATWTSTNGSKVGTCNYPGYSGTVFEPIDEFKGDFARTYFYMATRYQNIIDTWSSNSSTADDILNETEDQVFEEWFLNMIIEWHNEDPVSQREIDRNNAVYAIQHNRNPYIDYPEFVDAIFGSGTNPTGILKSFELSHVEVFPNPASDNLTIKMNNSEILYSVELYSITGENILHINDINSASYTIKLGDYPKGIYFVKINGGFEDMVTRKIIIK